MKDFSNKLVHWKAVEDKLVKDSLNKTYGSSRKDQKVELFQIELTDEQKKLEKEIRSVSFGCWTKT